MNWGKGKGRIIFYGSLIYCVDSLSKCLAVLRAVTRAFTIGWIEALAVDTLQKTKNGNNDVNILIIMY